MVKLHERLKVIYPESYGAKALQDPRGGDLDLAKRNSRLRQYMKRSNTWGR